MKSLEGLKVLDLTRALAGPFCTLMLGDHGADVIKIEIPGSGDDTRHWGPPFIEGESAYFMSINRNKRSLTLNFKEDEAKEIFLKMSEGADVIVENFTPGVMERFGLGYDEVRSVNPRIIYTSISGFRTGRPLPPPSCVRPDHAGHQRVDEPQRATPTATLRRWASPSRTSAPACGLPSG